MTNNDKQMISLLRCIAMDQAYLMDAIDMIQDDTCSAFGEDYTKWKNKRRQFLADLDAQEVEDNA